MSAAATSMLYLMNSIDKRDPKTTIPIIYIGMPVAIENSQAHQSSRKLHPPNKQILRKKHNTSFFGTGFSI